MELLAIIKLVNTGVLVWDKVGPLVQSAMEKGETSVSMADLEAASGLLGKNLQALADAIEKAQAEGR